MVLSITFVMAFVACAIFLMMGLLIFSSVTDQINVGLIPSDDLNSQLKGAKFDDKLTPSERTKEAYENSNANIWIFLASFPIIFGVVFVRILGVPKSFKYYFWKIMLFLGLAQVQKEDLR